MEVCVERVFIPAEGLCAWRSRLADPEKHWKREAPAFETAVAWAVGAQSARGLPPAVAEVLDQAPELQGASLLDDGNDDYDEDDENGDYDGEYDEGGGGHARRLLPVIEQLFKDAGVKWKRTNARGYRYSIAEDSLEEFLRWDCMPWE